MSFDVERALGLVAGARSRFCQLAAEWLTNWDDPVDLLFALSRETGQALGPWETFRFCALLGLTPSDPVKELALDVLAEPLDAADKTPPIAHAAALAHAIDCFPEEDALYAAEVLDALRARSLPGVPEAVHAAAVLGLAAQTQDPRGAAAQVLVAAELARPESAFVVPCLEAAVLSGDGDLLAAAWAALGGAQEPDGAVRSEHRHPTLRALVTLRALCLVKRGAVRGQSAR